MTTVVLDAGALIALERGAELVRLYISLAAKGGVKLVTSSAVVAQVWRGGARQARVARLLASELAEEVPLDDEASRQIGILAAATGGQDVVDGHVALLSGDDAGIVLTSDPDDIRRWGVPKERLVKT